MAGASRGAFRLAVDFLVSLGKSILLLPIGALLEVPFIMLGVRILVKKRLSFGAAYLMALISGLALIAAHAALYPVLGALGNTGQAALSLGVALAVASGLYGYFITAPNSALVIVFAGGRLPR